MRGTPITLRQFALVCFCILSFLATSSAAAQTLKQALADGSFWKRPGPPTDLTLTIDASRKVSQVIGPDGGALSLQGDQGDGFTLMVPPGALSKDTAITMSLVTKVSGLPRGTGRASVVHFSPAGLMFKKPAELIIGSPAEFGSHRPIAFTALSDGKDFALAQRRRGPDFVGVYITHFSTVGIARNDSASAELEAARSVQRSHERMFEHAVAAINPDGRLGEAAVPRLPPYSDAIGKGQFWDLIRSYMEFVVGGRIGIALQSKSCSDVGAVTDAMIFGTQSLETAQDDDFKALLREVQGQQIRRTHEPNFQKHLTECVKQSVASCTDALRGKAGLSAAFPLITLDASKRKEMEQQWVECQPRPFDPLKLRGVIGFNFTASTSQRHSQGGESWRSWDVVGVSLKSKFQFESVHKVTGDNRGDNRYIARVKEVLEHRGKWNFKSHLAGGCPGNRQSTATYTRRDETEGSFEGLTSDGIHQEIGFRYSPGWKTIELKLPHDFLFQAKRVQSQTGNPCPGQTYARPIHSVGHFSIANDTSRDRVLTLPIVAGNKITGDGLVPSNRVHAFSSDPPAPINLFAGYEIRLHQER